MILQIEDDPEIRAYTATLLEDEGFKVTSVASAEAGLSGMLGRFFALSEAYPQLKSNENMMQLSEELSTTENKIAFARQAYNDAVMRYNNKCEQFPGSIVAGIAGPDDHDSLLPLEPPWAVGALVAHRDRRRTDAAYRAARASFGVDLVDAHRQRAASRRLLGHRLARVLHQPPAIGG